MTTTVNQLISGAYHSAGIVAREFETVSGQEVNDGLQFLNDILAEKAIDGAMIPYETEHNFNAVVGQEEYSITDLVLIDTLTFVKDSVRYPLSFSKRQQYLARPRTETIETLPQIYYYQRELGGSKLFIYPLPDEAYPFTLFGTFHLSSVAIGDDLESTLDRFYVTYLRYALADRLCAEFAYDTPANVRRQLGKYEHWIAKQSRRIDLRMQKASTLQTGGGINWAYVNLGNGWVRPG